MLWAFAIVAFASTLLSATLGITLSGEGGASSGSYSSNDDDDDLSCDGATADNEYNKN